MPTRRTICSAMLTLALLGASAPQALAASTALAQVRAVYRTVLTTEYFGPASGVCAHLSPAGVRSFTAGGTESCVTAFHKSQHVLRHKVKGLDNSGYTAAQWRHEVTLVMGELKIHITGTHASAIGADSGIPGRTNLVEIAGKWLFSSYPPSFAS